MLPHRTVPPRWVRQALAIVAVACVAGCGGGDVAPPASSTADGADLDALRALPYVDFSSDPADGTKRGVVLYDEQRSCPGYNLYSNHSLCSAELIDARGDLVRAWHHPCRHWANVELLDNGDLLVVGTDPAGDGSDEPDDAHRFVMRFSWDGALLWKRAIPAHHDIERTPRGDLLTLTARVRSVPEFHAEIAVRDNGLALLSDDGEIGMDLSFFDLFSAAAGRFAFQPVRPRVRRGVPQFVLFHANSVEWMHHDQLAARDPLYGPANVLVCSRHQDTIAVLDWDRRELVWSWGQGILSGPHDATVLDNGNFLVFDNGMNRGWSRVLELDPRSRRIVWEYRAPEPTDFFTLTRGSSQRLPNGNTLIANSESGEAFEVTRDGERVWEFWSPHFSESGERGTLVRMKRYPVEFVDSILAVQTLNGSASSINAASSP